MTDHLPDAVQKGLEMARKTALRRQDRLCVHDGDDVHRVRRFWDGGFALDRDGSERLRGRIDIYDGARHLYQCLVVSSDVEGDERVFDFKWLTPVTDRAPIDFVRETEAPVALLGR